MIHEEIEAIPFHQYQRYKMAQIIVNSQRNKPKHRILEIGASNHRNLEKFLPDDEILYLDKFVSEENRGCSDYIQGDIVDICFEEESFDFVIALDVIEHIAPKSRFDVIKKMQQICKLGFIASLPIKNSYNVALDRKLSAYYKYAFDIEVNWNHEHEEYGLPDIDEVICDINNVLKISPEILYHGDCLTTEKLMYAETTSLYGEKYAEFWKEINSHYNKDVFFSDLADTSLNSIRAFVFYNKDNDVQRKAFISTRRMFNNNGYLKTAMCNIIDSFINQVILDKIVELNSHRELQTQDFYSAIDCSNKEISSRLMTHYEELSKQNTSINSICREMNDCNNELKEHIIELLAFTDMLMNSRKFRSSFDLRNIRGGKDTVKVSVLLVTYNHEKYIREALDSIVMQQYTDNYEIVVADDCSTDNTITIIKEYANNYDVPFVFLNSETNLGITKNYERAFKSCRGEYIAIIEGDDYWTDPRKLEKHTKFLDDHRECSMSFNRYIVMNRDKGDFILQPWPIQNEFEYITVKGLVLDNYIGNFSTCVYRREILENLNPELFTITVYDWMINIAVANNGLIAYLGDIMSVYRQHSNGKWSSMNTINQLEEWIRNIDIYNKHLGFVFDKEFNEHKQRLERHLMSLKQQEIIAPAINSRKFQAIKSFKDYVPPIVKIIVKLIVPEKVIRKIMG